MKALSEFLECELHALLADKFDVAAIDGSEDSESQSQSQSQSQAGLATALPLAQQLRPRLVAVSATSPLEQMLTLVDRTRMVDAFVPSHVATTVLQKLGYTSLAQLRGSLVRIDKYHFATAQRCERDGNAAWTPYRCKHTRMCLWVDELTLIDTSDLAVNGSPVVNECPRITQFLDLLNDDALDARLAMRQGLLPLTGTPAAADVPIDRDAEHVLDDAECIIPDDQEAQLAAQDGWGLPLAPQPSDSQLIAENESAPMSQSQSQALEHDVSEAVAAATQPATVVSVSQGFEFQTENLQRAFVHYSSTDSDSDTESNASEDEQQPASQQSTTSQSGPADCANADNSVEAVCVGASVEPTNADLSVETASTESANVVTASVVTKSVDVSVESSTLDAGNATVQSESQAETATRSTETQRAASVIESDERGDGDDATESHDAIADDQYGDGEQPQTQAPESQDGFPETQAPESQDEQPHTQAPESQDGFPQTQAIASQSGFPQTQALESYDGLLAPVDESESEMPVPVDTSVVETAKESLARPDHVMKSVSESDNGNSDSNADGRDGSQRVGDIEVEVAVEPRRHDESTEPLTHTPDAVDLTTDECQVASPPVELLVEPLLKAPNTVDDANLSRPVATSRSSKRVREPTATSDEHSSRTTPRATQSDANVSDNDRNGVIEIPHAAPLTHKMQRTEPRDDLTAAEFALESYFRTGVPYAIQQRDERAQSEATGVSRLRAADAPRRFAMRVATDRRTVQLFSRRTHASR